MADDRKPYPSALALVMARTQKRIAEKYDDQELAQHPAALEERAQQAVRDGKSELPELN